MKTLSDLESAFEAVRAEVVDIQTQLAVRKPVGRVEDAVWREYMEWSKRAKAALRWKLGDLARAKADLKNARREFISNSNTGNPATFGDLASTTGLIRASYATLNSLATEIELEAEEQALIAALHVWLQKNAEVVP